MAVNMILGLNWYRRYLHWNVQVSPVSVLIHLEIEVEERRTDIVVYIGKQNMVLFDRFVQKGSRYTHTHSKMEAGK